MVYEDVFYVKENRLRVKGIPVFSSDGNLKAIAPRKSYMDLYSQFPPTELTRLSKRTEKLQNEFIYRLVNSEDLEEESLHLMEDSLNDAYNRMYYMLITGRDSTIDYTEGWLKEWEDSTEDEEKFYIGIFQNERIFNYVLHLIKFYYKVGYKIPGFLENYKQYNIML